MNSVRQILWKVLVVGMTPFILGAGLPQLECQCAAAKGQLFCECCFRKPDESRTEDSAKMPCCRQHSASVRKTATASECTTCQHFRNPKTGSCCSLKQATAPTLTKSIDVSEFDVATLWLPLISTDWQAPAISLTAQQTDWSRVCCGRPLLDRVIVFEHLVI